MNIKILPSANDDLFNSYQFYEQREQNKAIIIYAVLDCRKQPAWIKGRFE